jgi:hypothetical protein
MDAAEAIAVAGVAVALATALAGLYQDALRRRLFGPRLVMRAEPTVFPVRTQANGPYVSHIYVRLLVSADERRAAAEDLQVVLESCFPSPHVGEGPPLQSDRLAIPLRWAFTHDRSATLAPGQARYVDLLEIRPGPRGARLTTSIEPKEGYVLTPREDEPYVVLVSVAGTNAPSRHWAVRLHLKRDWVESDGVTDDDVTVSRPLRTRGQTVTSR